MLGLLKEWNELPEFMKSEEVRPYYNHLKKKKISLCIKRLFDVIFAFLLLFILSPIMIAIAIAIVCDSKGAIFFRQERVTQYGRKFYILKFRTMVTNAETLGAQVTVKDDIRITKVGTILRKCRLDEFPQLINIILGDMSFVGTRPEVTKYVNQYSPEMFATLLLPAGVTSEASIQYKDEDKLLETADNVDETYIKQILPGKMEYNLKNLKEFSFWSEIRMMIKTVPAVLHQVED